MLHLGRWQQPSTRASSLPTPAVLPPPVRSGVVCSAGRSSRRRSIIKYRPSVDRTRKDKTKLRDAPRNFNDLDPDSPQFAGRLTTEINSCNGPLQLSKLVQEHGERFSGTQATMTLARLAAFATFQNLDEEQVTAQARAVRRCMIMLRERADDCDLVSHARATYAMGRLGLRDNELLSLITSEAYDRLNLLSPDGLAALIAGLAALDYKPPQGWLDRFTLEVYTRFTTFTCSELSAIAYALCRLGHTPSLVWGQRCLEAFRTAATVHVAHGSAAAAAAAAAAADGAMALGSAAALRAASGRGASPVASLAVAARGQGTAAGVAAGGGGSAVVVTAPALVKFAFAVAVMRIPVTFNWYTSFTAAARIRLDALTARELAVLLWALARMDTRGTDTRVAGGGAGTPLDRPFLDAWFRCAAKRMGGATPASLVLALQALAALRVFPLPAKFLAALMPQLQAVVQGALPKTHTHTASGMGSTNTATAPPPATHEQQQQGQLVEQQQGQEEEVEAGHGPVPSRPRQEGIGGGGGGGGAANAGAGLAGAPPLSGPEAVSLLLSVVALRLRPPAEWVDDALEVVRLSLPSLGLPVLCDAAWALARLQFQPTEAWMEDYEEACVHAVSQRVAAAAAAAAGGGGPRAGRGARGRKGAGRGREGSGRGRGRGQGALGLEGPLPGDVVRQLRLLHVAYGELQLEASEPLAGLMRRAVEEAVGAEVTQGAAQGEAKEAPGRQDATAAAAGAAAGADQRGSGGGDGALRLGQQGGRQGTMGGGGGAGGEGVGQGEQGQGQGDLQAKLADLLLGPI